VTLSAYFMSDSVLMSALLDLESSTFKNNCMKSNKHRPVPLEVCSELYHEETKSQGAILQ